MTLCMSDSIIRNEEALVYAILSHRWCSEEITLQDFEQGNVQEKRDWRKVKDFCSFIRSKGYRYGWIDTCCIDKTSSAELSEAINSMFLWYKRSDICYVYLEDVGGHDLKDPKCLQAFHNSEWFTRGWTLQELLAPECLMFVDVRWNAIGTKQELVREVSQITGIPHISIVEFRGHVVTDHYNRDPSVADILSWAAHRTTSREEDQAYSLLGLFGVYMSPIYGEGQNAFTRLQVQIIESCEDDTIFTWDSSSIDALHVPLLAPHVKYFAGCNYANSLHVRWHDDPPERRMTNKGLRVEKLLRSLEGKERTFLMPLNCRRRESFGHHLCAAVVVRKFASTGKFHRCSDSRGRVREHEISDRKGFKCQLIYSA